MLLTRLRGTEYCIKSLANLVLSLNTKICVLQFKMFEMKYMGFNTIILNQVLLFYIIDKY